MNNQEVASLSRELNEPKWLLQERLKSLKIYEVLSKEEKTEFSSSSFGESDLSLSMAGARKDSLHAFLENKDKRDIAKSFFVNRFFRPEKSLESAFINAFFTECNFFAPEKTSATIELKRKKGISIDFFIVLPESSLGVDLNLGAASISEYYLSENSTVFQSSSLESSGSINFEARILQANALFKSNRAFFSSCRKLDDTLLNGERSKLEESSVSFSHGTDKFIINSAISHTAPDTQSILNAKGVAKDSSSLSIDIMARINKEAKGAKSKISTQSIILNPGAKASSNPEFEIFNNDVNAVHSASIGEIDEEQIFYLMSRGLGPEEAKKMIVEGFLTLKDAQKPMRESIEKHISAIYKSSSSK